MPQLTKAFSLKSSTGLSKAEFSGGEPVSVDFHGPFSSNEFKLSYRCSMSGANGNQLCLSETLIYTTDNPELITSQSHEFLQFIFHRVMVAISMYNETVEELRLPENIQEVDLLQSELKKALERREK